MTTIGACTRNKLGKTGRVSNGFKPKRLTPRATELLSQLPWRGNVRELRNLMERLAVLVSKEAVTHRDVSAPDVERAAEIFGTVLG